MARIEFRCTEQYKKELKAHVESTESDLTSFIKAAIYEKRLRDLKED